MENNINDVLACKRAWRNYEFKDTRHKDGTPDERKFMAAALRRARRERQQEGNTPWWKAMFTKIGFLFVLVILFNQIAFADQGSRIVAAARSQIGVHEEGGNNEGSRIFEYTKGRRIPWCASFVSYTLRRAGFHTPYLYSARSYFSTFKSVRTPRSGDIICFYRGSRNGPYGHVGIVEKVEGNRIITIQGNVGHFPARVREITYRDINHIPHLLGFVRVY